MPNATKCQRCNHAAVYIISTKDGRKTGLMCADCVRTTLVGRATAWTVIGRVLTAYDVQRGAK